MSSKAKTDQVGEVAEKLAESAINGGDSEAAKKREKKMRQKAKKEAEKKSGNDNDENAAVKTEKNGEKSVKDQESKPKSASANKKKSGAKVQTSPPSVPISELFPNGNFPEGQIMDHPIANDDAKAKNRFTSEEARALDRAQLDMYNEVR